MSRPAGLKFWETLPMRGFLLAVLLFALYAFNGVAQAHEGHDHGAPPPPVSSTIAPRADASSNDVELVIVARGDMMEVYIDHFRTNEPITGAAIEIDSPSGTIQLAEENGVYVGSAPWLATPGTHDLAVTIQGGDIIDVLTSTLTIPPVAEDPALPKQEAGFVPDAFVREIALHIPAEVDRAWLAAAAGLAGGLAIAMLFRRRNRSATVAIAMIAAFAWDVPISAAEIAARPNAAERDLAQRFADGALFVPKPTQRLLDVRSVFTEVRTYTSTIELAGRVIPDPNGSGLVQTTVAGRLVPPAGGFPGLGAVVTAGQTLAIVEPAIDSADITGQEQQSRELDQQVALVEKRLKRWRSIADVVTRQQIEEAEIEREGLLLRRENLKDARRRAEMLVAPVSGVIASVQAVAGQVAEPNAVIFRIVDPARLWVEASSYQAYPFEETAAGRIADGRSVALEYRGTGLAGENQAIPVHFAITGDAAGLRIGQLLTVLAQTSDQRTGIALPRTSVLRGPNGQPVVYEHTNAERFVPREVRVEPLDGANVLIVSGVEPGRRIVTQGAELLNQIR